MGQDTLYRCVVETNRVIVYPVQKRTSGGVRGTITDLSDGSRKRMLHFLNAVVFDRVAFVTLTYHANVQDVKQGYRDVRTWHKALERICGPLCVAWRVEKQKRGALHYHCFIFDGNGVTESIVRGTWLSSTGQDGDLAARKHATKTYIFGVLEIADAGVIVAYMAKYSAKGGAVEGCKNWGLLGRKNAHIQRTTYTLALGNPAECIREIAGAGGWVDKFSDGGNCAAVALGSMGNRHNTQRGSAVADWLLEIRALPLLEETRL